MTNSLLKSFPKVILAFVVTLGAMQAKLAHAEPPSPPINVCEVTSHRDQYDYSVVIIDGFITSVRVYKRGTAREYTIAQIKDVAAGCYIRIFMRHRPEYQGGAFIQTGTRVAALAFYYKVFPHWGHGRYQNEIHPSIYYIGDCQYELLGGGWTLRQSC